MTRDRRLPFPVLVTALLLSFLTASLVLLLRSGAHGTGFLGGYAGAWAVFAAAALVLRRVPRRHVVPLVLAGAVAVTAAGLVAAPRTSTDSYRYAWDGRVQAAGVSPYDHAPADPALGGLRDDWLFPGPEECGRDGSGLAPLGDGRCTRINRPAVHTIYPPVAEGWFLLVHVLSPEDSRHKGLQVASALLALAVTGLLLGVLRRRGDPRRAALWAWCPAVPVEAVDNAHVDVLAVLLSVGALALVARRRHVTGGVLLGLAVAAKLLPAVLLPGALSGLRRPRAVAAVTLAAAATVALAYLPYVLLSDGSVLGYLSGYAQEEGYDDAGAGGRYALLRLVLPDAWALPAAVLGIVAVSAAVWWRGDPGRPWSGALSTIGTAFLLLTPGYSWYALLLIALVALDGRWEWLGVALAGAVAYLAGPVTGIAGPTAAYGAAGALVCAVWWARRRSTGRSTGPRGGRAGRAEVAEGSPAPYLA
ncbi:glycosyltransferase family 87 protein [Streptomyces sp. CC208A]|uniref:glycosyltransferase family 87 protein n=1 Tax=Streptomyces sp. CC208A TaxID=3044573 RepID=UPI0024A88139|nr:glycosyltransferase family 87 protein [Streptomyces sp. CC208A]